MRGWEPSEVARWAVPRTIAKGIRTPLDLYPTNWGTLLRNNFAGRSSPAAWPIEFEWLRACRPPNVPCRRFGGVRIDGVS